MGNSNSSQRREGESRVSQHARLDRGTRSRSPDLNDGHTLRLARRRTLVSRNMSSSQRLNISLPSVDPHQISANQSQPLSRRHDIIDDSTFESDSRPLFDSETAALARGRSVHSLSRSPSTMSRLGSRLLPDSVVQNLLLSGEETAQEGEALRQGVASRRHTSVWERRAPSSNTDRFSISGTFRRHMESRAESRRRSIRGPFPLGHSEHQALQGEPSNSLGLESTAIQTLANERDDDDLRIPRGRFSRVRHSLSLPLSNLFNTSRDHRISHNMPRSSTPHPGNVSPVNDSDHLLPSITMPRSQSGIDNTFHELDAVEPETRNVLSSSRITSGMSTIRRISPGFRSRSRLIRRGEHPPLSHVLQLAAAAIAAQLGGQSGSGADGLRTLRGEAFDGSIQNFVRTLQDAASAQAGEDIDINATDGELPPVNFMRVFQFPNDENGTPIPHAHEGDRMSIDGNSTNDGDRSVTLVLVGVRSMPHAHDIVAGEHGGLGPSLDTLSSLPFLPPATMLNNGGSGALFRRADGRTRTSRRHSLTNFNFPAQYETQRHYRTRSTVNRTVSDQPGTSSGHNANTPASDSPPGPHPPPSTPADIRSGHATPSRRPSSASGVHTPILPDLGEDHVQEQIPVPTEQSFTNPRQRRRSDSEYARRPELGSGAARRNGMVEPDRPAVGTGRSWLIYVVGTNVSPDHPAFTMPSLFTDNPTYEDMQMLSTLLGPAKPPVASQDDINIAGGLYRLALRNGNLLAEPLTVMEDGHVITISKGDRCLICLCDYDRQDEVRELDSCRHVFHRECIDEWLTTGRNSCPMCRGQGVKESAASSSTPVASTSDA